MPERRPLSTRRLLQSRSRARLGLLASAAATVAAAVATVTLVQVWLAHAIAVAGDPPPPGIAAEEVAAQVDAGAAALASAAPALALLVAILAGTAVAQLARLIAAAREHETAAVRARGLSRRQATIADAIEAAAVALSGAVCGLVAASVIVGVAGMAPAAALAQWPWLLATAVALGVVFAVALRRGEARPGSARGARVTTGAAVAVIVLAAALVVWQLPLARVGGFDPIVAIAPAVVLMAGALVALAVFGAAATAAARPAAAIPALVPGYPLRQIARRLQINAVAVLLVALTAAQAVFASAYAGSWEAMTADSAAMRAGADLRVDLRPQSATPAEVAAATAVPGVEVASPALVTPIEIGATDAQLVAVPSEQIEPVVSSAGGLVDKDALMALAVPQTGTVETHLVGLGPDATGLRVTASVRAEVGNPSSLLFVAVLVDATGTPTAVQLDGDVVTDSAVREGVYSGEAALPEGAAPWRLLAVAAGLAPGMAGIDITVALDAVEAVGEGRLDLEGAAAFTSDELDQIVWLADGDVRSPAAEGAEEADAPAVAAVVTGALASRLGVGVGDPLDFRYAGTGRQGQALISAVVPAVPGSVSSLALFVPLETLLTSQLQRGTSIVAPTSVWAAGDVQADDALSAALGDRPVTTASPGLTESLVGALVGGWWIATAGSVVLSLVAAFAIVQTLAIARRRELGVLRALGVAPGRQAGMRAGELGGVFGAALLLGGAVGLLASWLIVPSLVKAVTPGILSLAGGLTLVLPPLALVAAAVVAGLGLIVFLAAMQTRRAALAATVGEEAR
jgi:hypothetical protein